MEPHPERQVRLGQALWEGLVGRRALVPSSVPALAPAGPPWGPRTPGPVLWPLLSFLGAPCPIHQQKWPLGALGLYLPSHSLSACPGGLPSFLSPPPSPVTSLSGQSCSPWVGWPAGCLGRRDTWNKGVVASAAPTRLALGSGRAGRWSGGVRLLFLGPETSRGSEKSRQMTPAGLGGC